jgi:hypothetical protein
MQVCNIASLPELPWVGQVLGRDGHRFKGRGLCIARMRSSSEGARCTGTRDSPNEVRAVVLIPVNRVRFLISPAYDRGEAEEQVKDRWRRYWRRL